MNQDELREEIAKKLQPYKDYIKLLSDELNDLSGLAYTHGWRSIRYEKGVELRKQIEDIDILSIPIGGEVGEETKDECNYACPFKGTTHFHGFSSKLTRPRLLRDVVEEKI